MARAETASNRILAEDVLPLRVAAPAIPVPLDTIQPWHRPRKQYVRERQWIFYSERLIKHLKGRRVLSATASGPPDVRYLTLPGIDYLDVRLLANVCRDTGCSLTSVGFIAGSERKPETARAKLRERSLIDAGHITSSSHTFPTRFEEIAPPDGQAIRELERKGPFHIVNVDVCGAIAPRGARHPKRIIDAIYRLVESQLARYAHRWLLFITVDVRPTSIEGRTLSQLWQAVVANASLDAAFRDAVLSRFGELRADMETVLAEAQSAGGYNFLRVFALGLAKWLIHLAGGKNWSILTHSPYCYSTSGAASDDPTMPCLAFEFIPPPRSLRDPFEVTRAEPSPSSKPTDDPGIRAVEKVAAMDDLDTRMRRCPSLRYEMASRTKQLLKEAGYSDSALSELDELDHWQ